MSNLLNKAKELVGEQGQGLIDSISGGNKATSNSSTTAGGNSADNNIEATKDSFGPGDASTGDQVGTNATFASDNNDVTSSQQFSSNQNDAAVFGAVGNPDAKRGDEPDPASGRSNFGTSGHSA